MRCTSEPAITSAQAHGRGSQPPELAYMSGMSMNGRPGMSDAWTFEQQLSLS